MRGVVLDHSRAPVPDVELIVAVKGKAIGSTRSSDDGRFLFSDVPDGDVSIVARRLGYKPASVDITVGAESADRVVEISIGASPTQLEEVEVVGENTRLHEFYERRKHSGIGRFFTHEEIEKINPRYSSDIFRRVPGASLRMARIGSSIRLRGCRPKVWIDGVPVRDVELDEVIAPNEIAGLEIYTSNAGIPPEYMARDVRNCGAILVWTRLQ